MLEINHITVYSAKIAHPLTFALCPDFHNGDVSLVLSACRGVDAILVAGDLVDRHDHRTNGFDNAVRVLKEAPDVAPVFYSIGNHERKLPALAEYWPHVEASRVTVLDDRFVEFGGIVLGGLSSIRVGKDEHKLPLQLVEKKPFLRAMAEQPGFRLLMCHHPEYYKDAVLNRDIDLTVAGHAHGGQVRIGRQGIYSPGQWLFPKLTSGFYYNDRLLVSRGVTNATWAPRINCGCEVIILHLEAEHA
ncbi:MAG: metallophosphoesterase [Clostridia bacterium]|nr:metallophosphoesterase [Clostridia bacterium]